MEDKWKKTLTEMLRQIKLISEKFTGKIIININDGHVGNVEKHETIK